jgi:large subunit ribosomal protein L4
MQELHIPLYTFSDKEPTETVSLDPTVFGVKPNVTLLHQAVVTHLANRRVAIAHTKDRSEVRGGGRKPWRQKGTGNARAGSIRSPLWRGGGITFGPTSERNYSMRMPQKMRQLAWKMALSSKVKDESLFAINSLDLLDGKTKTWVSNYVLLPKHDKKMLIVTSEQNTTADRSIRNLENHKYVSLASLTLYDIIRFPIVVMTTDAITGITQRLIGQSTPVLAPITAKPIEA